MGLFRDASGMRQEGKPLRVLSFFEMCSAVKLRLSYSLTAPEAGRRPRIPVCSS